MSNWDWLLKLATELPLTQCKYNPPNLQFPLIKTLMFSVLLFFFLMLFLAFYRACQFYVNFKYYSRGGLFAGTIDFMTASDGNPKGIWGNDV